MTGPRAILHVDMDAFYVSIEQLDDPRLRGLPVLVGHDGPRGVVSAASYESRVFGCRSAQPVAVARRLCPQAVIVPPRFARYVEVSERVFELFEHVTPLVEPLSIDEAFLDVTGCGRLLGEPPVIAAELRRAIRAQTGLTASVGVAWNKFLAKLASDMDKPDGLTVLTPADVPGRVAAQPVARLWGVGPVQERRLLALGLRTFADLQQLAEEEAVARLGEHGAHLWRLARGEDDRPVVPDAQAKSLGAEQTFEQDLREPDAVRAVLLGQTERVAVRLRRHALRARTVSLKIRFGRFQTISRALTLPDATDRTDVLAGAASELWARWWRREFRPVRLIGVSLSQLTGGEPQPSLFPDAQDERSRRLDRATDAVRARFGAGAIRHGIAPADALHPRDPRGPRTDREAF